MIYSLYVSNSHCIRIHLNLTFEYKKKNKNEIVINVNANCDVHIIKRSELIDLHYDTNGYKSIDRVIIFTSLLLKSFIVTVK